MKTIIVATDFSPAALNAVRYATDMAVAINAKILLLHIYQVSVIYGEIPVAFNEEAERQEAEIEIVRIKDEMMGRTDGHLSIETEVRLGNFFDELTIVCEFIKPYTVVMGSQGTTATERLLFGGHTVHAMKHLTWPLITVPATVHFTSIKNIGLACDFENVTNNTPVQEIKLLIKDFTATLHVLNTGKQKDFDPDIVFESGLLNELLQPVAPNYNFITNENIDEGIIDFTEKNNIDLLIVLPKQHTFLDKLLHKSITKQMVLHSHVPVMALHNSN